MSGADEAEAGGLRVGRFLTGAAPEPLDSTAVNAETQLIPIVETGSGDNAPAGPAERRAAPAPRVDRTGPDSPKTDVPKVRAVARRLAAALPALGPDGPSDVPPSVKSTVERRRQARGADADGAGTAASPTALAPPPEAPLLGQPESSTSRHSSAKHSATTLPKQRSGSADEASGAEESVADHTIASDFPGDDADTVTDGVPVDSALDAETIATPLVPARVEVPTVDTPTVAVPVLTAVTRALPRPVPQPASPVPAPASPVPVPEAATDAPAGGPGGGPEAATADPGDATGLIEPVAVRPGPPVLTEDSWDAPPDAEIANDVYQGRRRATVPWARVLLVVGLLLAVTAIFVVPMAFRGASAPSAGDSNGPGLPGYTGGDPYPTDESGQLVPAASSPGSRQSQRASRSATPAGTAPSGATSTTTGQGGTTPPPAAPPAFAPVVLQAEDASMSASSWQRDSRPDCSAGTAVVRTGRWTEYSWNSPGTLTFTVSVPSAGSYSVIVYAVLPSGSRRAEITVNGAGVPSVTFTSGCPVSRTFTANLVAGNNQIRFTNGSDRGPTIDRIEIRRA